MHSNDPERCTTPGQGLDIGCGSNKGAGCVGMDRLPFDGVDVVFDFDSGQPWPFADSSFDFIRAIHVIEHVANPLHFFEEVHRTEKPGCEVHLETPHYSSNNSWGDPTHVRHYSVDFLDVVANGFLSYPKPKYKVSFKEIRFSGLLFTWPGWLISRMSRRKYEKYFAWIFPASSITVKASVLK